MPITTALSAPLVTASNTPQSLFRAALLVQAVPTALDAAQQILLNV